MNDLVTKQGAGLVDSTSDWGNTDTGINPIRCQIGQPTSKGSEIGKFNFKNKPDWKPTDILRGVVLLKPHKTRVLYGETFDSPARCGSDNSFEPSPRFKAISPKCDFCFARMWDNEATQEELEKKRDLEAELKQKEKTSPLCNESINTIVIDERMVPFVLTFQKTQIKIVTERLFNQIKYSGLRMFEQSFDISLKKKETAKGVWFEFEFSNFKPLEDKAKYKNVWLMMQGSAERILSEQHAAMDKEKEAAPIDPETWENASSEPPF